MFPSGNFIIFAMLCDEFVCLFVCGLWEFHGTTRIEEKKDDDDHRQVSWGALIKFVCLASGTLV